jgi:MtrB/PioB family decaheme-associated outer membrane protein
MSKTLLAALIAGLLAAVPAWGQDNGWRVQGSATLGPINDSTSDTKDASKEREYRDLSDGVLSNIIVRGRNGQNWFDGYGENFGRDDQYLTLRGGTYELFKFKIYTDSLRHNFLFNGLTPFAGSGTDVLSATFPQPDPATWNRIDVGYKRTDDGGFFEWQGLAPWYFRVDANQVKFDGTKIGSGANGQGQGNGFTDLAVPVHYNTKNATAEAGYNTGQMNLSLSYLYSRFDNDFTTLSWNNPFFANNVDTTYLPPDNHYQRVAANATFRALPWHSTLAARYTWSEGKSDADLAQTALNSTGPNPFGPTLPNVNHFSGKVEDQTFTLTLASHPIQTVDTRLYYNYYKHNNDSTEVIYSAASIVNCLGGPCQNDLFEYTKNNVGFDAYWRFMPKNRIGFGWDYWTVDQNRDDYDNIRTNKLFVEWKNTALANLSGRLRYTHFQRRSDYLLGNAGVNAGDPAFLARFTSRIDYSDLDRDEFKVIGDWSPMPLLDFSLEATWRDNKYKGVTLGRNSDKREAVYLSGSWGDPKRIRTTGFVDYERITYDSNHRENASGCNAATGPNCFDPSSPPSSAAFNWSARNRDRNWVVGVGADWQVMERLMVKGSALYYKTDGSVDISSQNNFGNPLPIAAFDDTERTSLNLKGIYSYDKKWSFTLGYAYERWRYSDAARNGYQYTVPFPGVSNNTSQSYLNGYLAFTNYDANIVYLLASYKFDLH